MFRLVTAGVAATSLGVMVGMAVIAIQGVAPRESLAEPVATVSFSVARPPPNSASGTSTAAAPEPRTIAASPQVPTPAPAPAPPTAVANPAPPLAALSPRASPAPTASPAHPRHQSDDGDGDDDDDDDDC